MAVAWLRGGGWDRNFIDIIWYCENTVGGSLTWDGGSAEFGTRSAECRMAKLHGFSGGGGYFFKRMMVGRRGAPPMAGPQPRFSPFPPVKWINPGESGRRIMTGDRPEHRSAMRLAVAFSDGGKHPPPQCYGGRARLPPRLSGGSEMSRFGQSESKSVKPGQT
jgi:hypothetical protein